MRLINRPIKIFLSIAVITVIYLTFMLSKSSEFMIKFSDSYRTDKQDNVWTDTPDLTIMTRLFSGGVMEYYTTFLVGYHLFWPTKYWKNSDLSVVFDYESEADHQLATVLGNLPPYPKVFFEKKPKVNTFCSGWRKEGYSRQQYSNFYSDLYSDKTYIGIIDSDVVFSTPVTPNDLFINGKPRIFGYNGCCAYGFEKCLNEAIGGEVIGEFMVNTVFPVIIKREHFKPMREHITKQMKADSFENAFYKICSKYNYYSQFDLMYHYLWNFKRDEYSWHLKDSVDFNFFKLPKRMTDNEKVKEKYVPIVDVAVMIDHSSSGAFKYLAPLLCEESNMSAGSCKKYKESITKWKQENVQKIFELENGVKPEQHQKPWDTKYRSWNDAKKIHSKNLYQRYKNSGPSFVHFDID